MYLSSIYYLDLIIHEFNLNSLGFPLQLNLHNSLALDLLSLTKSILDLARCIIVKLSNNNTSPTSYL